MADDRFQDFLRETARLYHPPPETPRKAIWSRIEKRRPPARSWVWWRDWRPRWLSWPLAAATVAAALALGLLLARGPSPGEEIARMEHRIRNTRSAMRDGTRERSVPRSTYRVAAAEYLTQAEMLLTEFRTGSGGSNASLADWARDLLGETRLLLDSPASEDPEVAGLLRDLELVLAQIAQLDDDPPSAERRGILAAVDDRALLMRIRFKLPAGTVSLGI